MQRGKGIGKRGKKGRKEEGKEEGRNKGNRSKKEGKYPYFDYLFNMGPYDCQKKSAKNMKEFQKKNMGEG